MNSAAARQPEFVRSSNFFEKMIRHWAFWTVFIAFGFSYPIYRSLNRTLPPELPIIAHVPAFTLTNENNQSFGSNDLKGKVYLANFIFSSCPTTCPGMLKELQKIQKRMSGTKEKTSIVTFTVDPENDTPAVLFKLARQYDANPYAWTFLTSTNKDELLKLYRDGFKVAVEPSVNLMEIAHSEKIVLVDGENRVRGFYSFDENSVNQLMIDVGLLINRPPTKE